MRGLAKYAIITYGDNGILTTYTVDFVYVAGSSNVYLKEPLALHNLGFS